VRDGRRSPPGTDDPHERRQLQGRLPSAGEDAEATSRWTYVVPAGVLGAAEGAESATSVSGDEAAVRNTWRRGLQSTFAGV
jgi:hypothetical protein